MIFKNTKPYIDEVGALHYSVWYSNGSMMVRREYLEADHPENLYNHLKTHGIEPELYGVYHPKTERMKQYLNWSKEKIIAELISVQDELESALRYL